MRNRLSFLRPRTRTCDGEDGEEIRPVSQTAADRAAASGTNLDFETMKEMNDMKKRFLSVLLCLVLVVGLLPTVAFAAGTDKAIQLGTSGIAAGDEVYYGIYNDGATDYNVPWYALNTSGLMLSKYALGTSLFRNIADGPGYYAVDEDGNASDSLLKRIMEGLYNGTGTTLFTPLEQSTIKPTDIECPMGGRGLTYTVFGAHLFPLTLTEAKAQGWIVGMYRARSITNPTGRDSACWTRSSIFLYYDDDNNNYNAMHYWEQDFPPTSVVNDNGVRPAFNLNLNSVLFTSAAMGGKAASGIGSGLTAVTDYDGNEWKLTLLDSDRNFNASASTGAVLTKKYGYSDWTVDITYSGANTGENEYVSAMLVDSSDNVLYYGRLRNIASNGDSNGNLTISVPSGLSAGAYSLHVFSEQDNGDYKTDYASAFQTVTLTVDNTAPTLSAVSATRSGETNATVKFTSDEAGTYHYAVVERGATAPSIDTTAAGTACTNGENIIALTSLSGTGAKDIYIVAKDAVENVSDQLKITIPAPIYSIAADPVTLDFGSAAYGYAAPAAQTVTIMNTGNQQITLTQPTASDYTIGELSKTDLAAGETATFTVQPKAGIAVGNYDETLTISGSDGVSAQVQLLFTVNKAEQTAPAKPELDSRTKNSITLKAIPDNANGAKAQYRMNDGEWQDSPVFTGLSSGTEYSFTARYAETDSYAASPASEAATFRTDSSGGYNPPVYYTLTFETNGGDKLSPVSGSYNALIDLSKYTPKRSGYAFTGWYSDKGLTEKITSIRLNGSKTVYAGWQAEQNPNTGANPFTDVNTTDWFYNDVMFVYEKGLMLGTSKTTFSPYGTATRGMMATILWRMEGSPAPKGGNGFADVDAGKWYADAITWTAENGIFRGYDNNLFMPEDPITREQLAAIFYRYADFKGYDTSVKGNLSKFKDADKISDYAETAMQWAVGSGLIKGRDNGTLDPQGTATRAEIAAMLHRFIEKYDLVQGTTSGGMTGWISRNRLQIPQTGDSSALGLWGFTLCASLAAFLALGTRQLRRREEEAALQIIEK